MKTVSLPSVPIPTTATTAEQVVSGLPVPAIERLRLMSDQQWEEFILEWVHCLKPDYHSVERYAGSGDLGCDVVGKLNATADGPWDNYQCKHYKDRLAPHHIWEELGKLCYYTFIREYSAPRRYLFVAPQGAGNSASKLLRDPTKLRAGLIANWDTHCRKKITSTAEIPLDAALKKHIENFDFSIFSAPSPLTIIDDHRKTPWHIARFGGGLPARPPAKNPPAAVDARETSYVRALLSAYEERLTITLASVNELKDLNLMEHFQRARREFYSAESLREFSRDNVPPGTFEQLLDEIYSGVIDVIDAKHPDAVARVLACVQQAKTLTVTSNALGSRVLAPDKGGMCHQLANEKRVTWRK